MPNPSPGAQHQHQPLYIPHGLPPRRQASPAAPAMAWLPPAAARLARRVARDRRYGPGKAA